MVINNIGKWLYRIYLYKPLLINVSVSLIVSGVQPHMTLVHSKFADHLQDLTNLFQSLIDNGLKISPKKCQFFHTELVYMGLKFLIYNDRPSITPMKDKCEAIRRLDPPKTVRDCRKFCGMVNFLATFLKDLQKILIPIYNLT